MNYFNQFLIDYLTTGHTVSLGAMKELNNLTDAFLKNVDKNNYYEEMTLDDYFDYLKENMSSEYIGFFHLYFNEERYEDIMKSYLKEYL